MIWLYLCQKLGGVVVRRRSIIHGSILAGALLLCQPVQPAETNAPLPLPDWLAQPLSLVEALNLALQHNSAILKSSRDLEAANGLAVQTRAVAYPTIRGAGAYSHGSAVERFDFGRLISGLEAVINPPKDAWAGNIRLTQAIYRGGRIRSALRAASWLEEQALLQHQVVVADTLRDVRIAYYDTLLAQEQIAVHEAAVNLMREQLSNSTQRLQVGTVSHFEVLRAEVELVKNQTDLIKARNNSRLAKYSFINLLGYHLPTNLQEDPPLTLKETKEIAPYDVPIPVAIAQALVWRPEIGVQRASEKLQQENIVQAFAGYLPALDAFGGYGARNPGFENDFLRHVDGPNAGVEFNWDLYNGGATRGEVQQAQALLRKANTTLEAIRRDIATEVRIAYSRLVEAREVIASQQKVQEQAEEAVRLAQRRYEVGAQTQLDLLKAQTDLTQARTTQNQAWRDYVVALAQLGHALGQDSFREKVQPPDRGKTN